MLLDGSSKSQIWSSILGCGIAFVAMHTATADEPARQPEPAKPTKVGADPQGLEFFESQIRPLLAQRCYSCHSNRAKSVKGGLRLDSRAGLLRGGDTGPAVVPGDPAKSLLIDAVNYGDLYQMPPKSKLPQAEIDLLARWVKMGAPWPKGGPETAQSSEAFDLAQRRSAHWCWKPIGTPPPPRVAQTDWPLDDLDRFILARLERAELQPAGNADRATWLRRVSFDLTGLPPTPEEVQAFLEDQEPHSYERVVDRLLESPHFGERWARHWMDLVRYAETYGHEFDYPLPHAWRYRDYLVRAFNADVPYDQMIREHIAGDLLADPRRHPQQQLNESAIGTCFWWLGEATHAPVDVRGDEAGRIDNQIDVFGKTFLGITIACARCHDHKFDAISTRDYYALAGFLQSSRRQQTLLDPGGRIKRAAVEIDKLREQGDAALKTALARGADEPSKQLGALLLATRDLIRDKQSVAEIAKRDGLPAELLERWRTTLSDPAVKAVEHPLHAWWQLAIDSDADANRIAAYRDRLNREKAAATESRNRIQTLADFRSGTLDGWTVTGPAFADGPITGTRWDSFQGGLKLASPGVVHGAASSRKFQGVLRSPTFTLQHPHLYTQVRGDSVQIRVILDGYFMDTYNGLLFRDFAIKNLNTKGQVNWQRQAGDLHRYTGHRGYVEIIDHGGGFAAVQQVCLSSGGPPVEEKNPLARRVFEAHPEMASADQLAAAYAADWRATLARCRSNDPNAVDADWVNFLLDHRLLDLNLEKAAAELQQVATKIKTVSDKVPPAERVLGMLDGTPENERIHIRGNHRTLGEVVPRRLLQALGGISEGDAGSGRLDLANRVADPDNPLTSRVMVNRIWHHLFGRGLVASVDNFGVLGQKPSHPQLLDHLARRFTNDDWSIKRIIKSMVLSRTYRMSSTPSPITAADIAEKDPDNVLLHRAPIRRLEGEAIRDAMLAISGRLDPKPFGPSVAVHVTPFMQGRGRPRGNGPLDGNGRRSIYTEVRRNFLPPMMLAFDTPIPFNTIGRRNVSNVPAQALILMNNPLVVMQARVWADRLLKDGELDVDARIGRAFMAAYARTATDDELASAREFLDRQGREFDLPPEQARRDPRVWADLCHVLWNVKEFTYLH